MPGLLLDALLSGDPRRLAEHIAAAPERQFTMLDCHDGIPVRPDLDGLLPAERMRTLADHVVARGGNVSRILSAAHAGDVDVHQLNTTWFSAMDADDDRHVATRAIQLFARGVPQVYYVGLLAGSNDLEAIARTGDGRAINRHDYTLDEIATAMERPVVQRVLELVRLRNTHLAFEGRLHVDADPERLRLAWQHAEASLELEVDLPGGRARVRDGSESWRPV
jgi:sucrose phosphorylase